MNFYLRLIRWSFLSFVGVFVFILYSTYSLAYYGVISYSSLNYVKGVVFLFSFVVFCSCVPRSTRSTEVFFIFFAVLFGLYGFLVGIYFRGMHAGGGVHLLYYVFFCLFVILGYLVGGDLSQRKEAFSHFYMHDAVWRYGVIFALFGLLFVHFFRDVAHNPSITFPFLCMAFSFFLWRRNWFFLLLCLLAVMLTLKRGMWVAFFFLFLMVALREILWLLRRGCFKLNSGVIFLAASFSGLLAVLVAYSQGGIVLDNLFLRISMSIPSGFSYADIDAASSGRAGDLVAVFSKVFDDCYVFLGCGFGVEYNYFDYNEAWKLTSSWVKNGSDVMFLHFYLLFGFLGILVYFLFSMVFLLSLRDLFFSRWGSLLFFASSCYFLAFVICLFSFSFFDPLFPVLLGFYLAVSRFVRRREMCVERL